MIVVDTSALLAFYNPNDRYHVPVRDLMMSTSEPMVLNHVVIAEIDYLISSRFGVAQEIAVLNDIFSGAYVIDALTVEELISALGPIKKYKSLNLGLTDASLLVLANKFQTSKILTLDHRHFGTCKSLTGKQLKLLPQ